MRENKLVYLVKRLNKYFLASIDIKQEMIYN